MSPPADDHTDDPHAVIAALRAELAARDSDFAEHIDHQAATIDVLKAMSASPGDPQPVFDLIARRTQQLCDGVSGSLFEFDGEHVHLRAVHRFDGETIADAVEAHRRQYPMALNRGSVVCRAIMDRDVVHIRDADADPEIAAALRNLGSRSLLALPLLRDGKVVGAIGLTATAPGGFFDSQIALLKTFAEQAVIAIGSAQTYRALREQTIEVQEALERQTATADILKVINTAQGDLAPVFDAILEKAHLLCGATIGSLMRYDGAQFHAAVMRGFPPSAEAVMQHPIPPTSRHRELMDGGRFVHVTDLAGDPGAGSGVTQALLADTGVRTLLLVPLRQDDAFLGFISAFRDGVRPFAEREIALLESFAAQAVIAMENARLLTETREALEQQTATAEVLAVINANPGNLAPVFDAILEKAMRLCGAAFGLMYVADGERMRSVATNGIPAGLAAFRAANPIVGSSGGPMSRLRQTRRAVHIDDWRDEDIFKSGNPGAIALAELGGARTVVLVPLCKDADVSGAITIYRQEVRAFSAKEVALLENFAAQAVIAMENARLLTEQRGALERQTATAEVLGVINANPGNLAPVFDAMLQNALRLCRAASGMLYTYDGQRFALAASSGVSEAMVEHWRRNPQPTTPDSPPGQVLVTRRPVQVVDVLTHPFFLANLDLSVPQLDIGGGGRRSVLNVPLLKDNAVVGLFVIYRLEPGVWPDKQVALLENFAAQAVIAMENARLLGDLQQRTADLQRSVEYQAATIDVLKVMSASTADTQPVFDVILRHAMALSDAVFGGFYEYDGELVHFRAWRGFSDAQLEAVRRQFPRRPSRATVAERAILEGRVVYVRDYAADPDIAPATRELGLGSVLAVPLLRDGKAIGTINWASPRADGFTDAQIELLKTFAEQAVIAIGTTATFRALQDRTRDLAESLEMQSATADVLKAISRSAFDLDAVLDTLTRSAATLCAADTGSLRFRQGDGFRLGAAFGYSTAAIVYMRNLPLRPGRGAVSERVARSHAVEMVLDVHDNPDMDPGLQRLTPNRTALGVPLLRDGALEGVFVLGRTRVEAFTPRQIELVQTFADQALIAIENARLFEQVQARTRELAQSLDDLHRTQDRLIQTEKLASLGALTAGIAHEIKNPLNFINNFSALSVELLDELSEVLESAPLADTARDEVGELTAMLKGNLEKVVSHGKRADGIVKNMLLHSRQSGGERRVVDLNATVEEALNLAYHGARAEKPGFNVTLERDYDAAAGSVALFPQEFTRVLLNLIGNGFYAGARRKAESDDPAYEPTLTVSTEARPDAVIIRVRDNGVGMADSVKARIFEPFFTTKPAGEGTGLGLSLSHDIIVKQHNGSIGVESRVGSFTAFTVTIPRGSSGDTP